MMQNKGPRAGRPGSAPARARKLLFLSLLAGFLCPNAAAAGLVEDLRFFAGLESRLPGHPGNREAADFIEARFRALGLTGVVREEFPVVGPLEQSPALLEIEGERIRLHSAWPNDVRTSMLPREGLSARLVYAGDGSLHNYRGLEVPGSIVVMDFNSGVNWLEAATLGARAIIFLEPDDTTFYESRHKFLEIPLDIPRFYATAREARRLVAAAAGSAPATLHGRQEWRTEKAANIIGYIRGSDPELADQVVGLTAYYDSISVVPGIAPGADQASGISTLLHLAGHFSRHRPRRTVMFLAVGSHFQGLHGMTDFANRHYRTGRLYQHLVEDPIDLSLMVSLELSSRSDQLATWHNSTDLPHQRALAPYSRRFLGYLPEEFEGRLLNGVSPDRGMTFNNFLTEGMVPAGKVTLRAGLPTLSLVTAYDNRRYFDTPLDTFERVNTGNLISQAQLLTALLGRALDDPGLITPTPTIPDQLRTIDTRIVYFDAKTSFVPNEPVENAIVTIRHFEPFYTSRANRKSAFGVRGFRYFLTDADGRARVEHHNRFGASRMMAYRLDPESGRIVMAPDRGSDGARNYPLEVTRGAREWMIVLFNSVSANIYDFIDPRYLSQLSSLEIFDPSNSIPVAYGHTYHEDPIWQWSSDHEPVAVSHTAPGMRIKVTGDAGPLGKRILLINSTDHRTQAEAEGRGYDVTANPESFVFTPWLAARDMISINEFRINNFARFGIVNERLSQLHRESIEHFRAAENALSELDWFGFLTESRRAVGLQSRAYPDVRATTDDVIIGLIFYFLILLPFAFFFERLVFGFVNINKQIVAVFLIFVAVYIALRLVHPGFQLSNSPEIILLGFILIALSGIVISLLASKFEAQMQQLKRKRARIYEADVGRAATTGSAFGLGMANMKRRKLRTVLTSTTLILLTFTVLSFTSIMSYMRFNQLRQPYPPSFEGLMIRDIGWAPIERGAYSYMRNEFEGRGIVSPRSAYINPQLNQDTFVRVTSRDNEILASGLAGMSVRENEISGIGAFLTAGRWFEDGMAPEAIITAEMAAQLGLGEPDVGRASINVFGDDLLLRGIISSERLNDFIDLDGTRLTPTNFSGLPEREMAQMRMQRTARVMTAESVAVSKHEAENTVIVPHEFLLSRGGHLYSVAVGFLPGFNVREEVESFISRLAVTLYAGIGERTFVYSSMELTSFAGVGNLFVPILIASLIVLNTMLGAVYERIREIGIYSSIGLAPSHISALFFAEASVYAVVGAVAGYLLGQVVTRVLSEFNLLGGLTLNYSSLSAVTSTMIVMATVFLSTIFPARKASELSVPDITRKWVLPRPEGDQWFFDFPFTVGRNEVLGLMIFLRDYLDSYSVEAVGTFYTEETGFRSQDTPDGKEHFIRSRVCLAPFDLGVSQQLELVASPIKEFTFYTIKVRITREGGESADWQRLNRRFLDNIRKQFLVWRTIDTQTKEAYRREGEEIHGKQS